MRSVLRFISVLIILSIIPVCASAAYITPDVNVGFLSAYGAKVNPFLCNELDIVSIDSLVYESLFEIDSAYKPQALLAESWSNEGKNWTLRIRSGIMFHNGIEMVADDVVQSYNLIKQAGADNPYYGRLSLITEMEVASTFEIRFKSKYTGMLALYALTFPIAQRDTATSNTPMGTGPYWIVEYTDVNIKLEANPFWWKQQPNVHGINFIHYWDVGDELAALQSGEIDMLSTSSGTAALTKKLSYVTSLDYTSTAYEMMIPNVNGVLADKNLRKAVMYAIDYNTLISNVYLDMAQQSEVPIFPGSWLYESRSAVYYYSPERALQYIYDSGWKDMTGDMLMNKLEDNVLQYIDIKIVTYDEVSSNIRGNAAEQIKHDLEALGMRVTVKVVDKKDIRSVIKEGDYDLALMAVRLSEVPNMIPLFTEDGSANFAKRHSDYVDGLVAATVTAQSEETLTKAYSDLQLYITDELPIMGICFRTGSLMANDSLAGLSGTREFDVFSGIEFLVR